MRVAEVHELPKDGAAPLAKERAAGLLQRQRGITEEFSPDGEPQSSGYRSGMTRGAGFGWCL